jgi:hypothetical protein
MPRECAFCPSTAKISGEHIWSAWMEQFFTGEKVFTNFMDDFVLPAKSTRKIWKEGKLNWKAYVVCEPCNNGWMSDIEKWRAKPAMTDLIKDMPGTVIDQTRANNIAIFTFKTALIIDQLTNSPTRFFKSRASIFL